MANKIRLPNDTHRIAIIGKTGSGKTQAAAWHLSNRNFHKIPWVIIDFKLDGLLGELPAQEIGIKDNPPRKPGLYIVHPLPDQESEVEEFLWKLWAKEDIGLYIDEGYMIGNSPAFRAILTQGRSKNIPVIVLSQRPVWMSRFVFSESDFYQVFWLNDARDRKTVNAFVPTDINKRLEDFHSIYYDVGDDNLVIMKPVPRRDEIIERFNERLLPKKRIL